MLQLLEDTKLNKEQQLFVKNSMESANILLLLINDILDLSKIEAGERLSTNESLLAYFGVF